MSDPSTSSGMLWWRQISLAPTIAIFAVPNLDPKTLIKSPTGTQQFTCCFEAASWGSRANARKKPGRSQAEVSCWVAGCLVDRDVSQTNGYIDKLMLIVSWCWSCHDAHVWWCLRGMIGHHVSKPTGECWANCKWPSGWLEYVFFHIPDTLDET